MRAAFCLVFGLSLLAGALHGQSTCQILGAGSSEDRARAEVACTQAAAGFSRLMNQAAPEGELILSDTVVGFSLQFPRSGWRLYWPTSAAPASFINQAPQGSVGDHWTSTLPHEIGHAMLMAFVEPGANPPIDRYGSFLPDWLDEAFAIWMEPSGSRTHEVQAQFRELARVPTIAEFMAQSHPTMSDTPRAGFTTTQTFYPCPRASACPGRSRWDETMQIRSWTRDDGSAAADTAFFKGPLPESTPLSQGFYPLSHLLLEHIYESGGSDAVNGLVRRLMDTPPSVSVMVGLPGLANEEEAIERDWQHWFQQRSRR